jgi:putative ABC transport system substrate-binding protein
MHKTEQGVLQQSKLMHSLIQILLLAIFFLPHTENAEASAEEVKLAHKNDIQKNHIVIIYSPESILQSNIAQALSEILINKRTDIVISTATPENKKPAVNKKTDMIVSIGLESIQSANKHNPKTDKLFIATDPGKFRPDINSNRKKTVLYMTQPYCRQIQFIKLLNNDWKTVGFFNSKTKPVATNRIQQCAKKHDLKTYTVNTTGDEHLTDDIKKLLNHSDILLALPDKYIYNRKTVKNILLTSYRYRKPLIAFSKNFVNAGALASIHSNTQQIAQSASALIDQYINLGHQFKNPVNYPEAYDISINKQVFRALDLAIPDLDILKQALAYLESDKPVELP